VRAAIVLSIMPFLVGLILTRPYFGACLFIFTTFIRPQNLTWGFEEVRFALVISVATALGYLLNKRQFHGGARAGAIPWLWALMASMLLSTATAQVSVEKSLEWNDRFFKIAVFATLLTYVVDRRDRIDRAFFWYVIGMGVLAAWAFEQHFLGNERLEGISNGGDINHSNGIACAFAMCVPLAIAAAFNMRRSQWFWRWSLLGLAPLLCVDIVFTQSRAGYLALGTSGMAAMRYRKLRWKVFAILLVGTIGFLGTKYAKRAETIVQQGRGLDHSEDGSIALRVRLWEMAIGFWATSPVTGVGQQNSALLVKETTIGKAKSIHNTWIQILVDGGILSLTFYLGAVIAGLNDLRWARRDAARRGDRRTWNWTVAMECSLAAFAASATFNSFDYLELPYWLLALAGTTRAVMTREAGELTEHGALGAKEG
jgi:probable O-glycosylation ligase (exosortase A-associated)